MAELKEKKQSSMQKSLLYMVWKAKSSERVYITVVPGQLQNQLKTHPI